MPPREEKRWLFGCLIPGGAVITAGSIMGVLALGRMFEGCEFDLGPSEPKTLAAVDVDTGDQAWSRRFKGRGFVQVGGTDGRVVVLRDPRAAVRAVALDDGSDVWRTEPPGGAASVPVIAEGAVFVVGCDGNLYAYDAETGVQSWRTNGAVAGEDFWEISGLGYRSLGVRVLVADGTVVTAGAGEAIVRAFDASTGVSLWQAPLFGGVRDAPVITGEHVFVTDATGTTYAFELATGAVAWSRPDERSQDYLTTELVPAGEVVGIADIAPGGGSNETIFVDAITGAERWRMTTPNFGPFGHAIFEYDARENILYESSDGTSARDPATGVEIRELSHGERSSILIAGDSVVLEGHRLQAIDAATGQRRWSAYADWDEAMPNAYADDLVVLALGEELDTR